MTAVIASTENELQHGKWFLVLKQEPDKISALPNGSMPLDGIEIHAPVDQFYADPFVFTKDGKTVVFFEHFDYKRGRLYYIEVNEDGSYSEPKKLRIDIQTHASYPYVFEHNGRIYMVPETCHQNRIALYECTHFPDEWVLLRVIVPNVHAADPSIIHHEDRFYLFTLLWINRRNHFTIYHAEHLTGPWQMHAVINPQNIPPTESERYTRGAGRLFRKDGHLVRPAQYSGSGINGEGVIIYDVEKLSPTAYHESPRLYISGSPGERSRYVHTVNYSPELLVLDTRPARPTDPDHHRESEEEVFQKAMEANAYFDHLALEKAFALNSSGNGKPYYSIKVGGRTYPGERNWDARWKLFSDIEELDYKGMKVLDLGCNMNIALIYLKKFRGIESGVGVERPLELLNAVNQGGTIEAARWLAHGFMIDSSIRLQILDLNNSNYEEVLDTDSGYDLVIAMSILKWIDDQPRFLKYLSKFRHLLYEGHDTDDVEIERLRNVGFEHFHILGKTQTGTSYAPDNQRTLILFSK